MVFIGKPQGKTKNTNFRRAPLKISHFRMRNLPIESTRTSHCETYHHHICHNQITAYYRHKVYHNEFTKTKFPNPSRLGSRTGTRSDAVKPRSRPGDACLSATPRLSLKPLKPNVETRLHTKTAPLGKPKHSTYLKASQNHAGRGGQRAAHTIMRPQSAHQSHHATGAVRL